MPDIGRRSSMGKAKIAACCATLAFGCATSATATATTAGWMTNGALLTEARPLASTATMEEPFRLAVGFYEVECVGSVLKLSTPELVPPNKLAIKGGEFTSCNTSLGGACILEDSKINLGSLLGEA